MKTTVQVNCTPTYQPRLEHNIATYQPRLEHNIATYQPRLEHNIATYQPRLEHNIATYQGFRVDAQDTLEAIYKIL